MGVTIPEGRPPAELSGGFFVVRYQVQGRPVTKSRFHVAPFSRTVPHAYTGGPGTEENIHNTFSNLVGTGAGQGNLKAFVTTACRLELGSIWQRQSDGTLKRVAPLIDSDTNHYYGVDGTNEDEVTIAHSYTQNILNLDTVDRNKGRIRIVAAPNYPVSEDTWVFGISDGTLMEKLMNYLVAGSTQIVARSDGHSFLDPAHLTSSLVKNLRREQMAS